MEMFCTHISSEYEEKSFQRKTVSAGMVLSFKILAYWTLLSVINILQPAVHNSPPAIEPIPQGQILNVKLNLSIKV